MNECGGTDIRLFAKIENRRGMDALAELLPHADEIVIARGDLGNAVPLWELPAVQKRIAARCRENGTPFMVVTQMLASMEHSRVPTRAEMSDIFNAVLDGAASVMVTGETAAGEYPADVIRYLALAAHAAETFLKETRHKETGGGKPPPVSAYIDSARYCITVPSARVIVQPLKMMVPLFTRLVTVKSPVSVHTQPDPTVMTA